jgi:hypothetical protein
MSCSRQLDLVPHDDEAHDISTRARNDLPSRPFEYYASNLRTDSNISRGKRAMFNKLWRIELKQDGGFFVVVQALTLKCATREVVLRLPNFRLALRRLNVSAPILLNQ